MQEYRSKTNIKVESFQQQHANATYSLPVVDKVGNITMSNLFVKIRDWLVKYTNLENHKYWYIVMSDESFRDSYEAVPAPSPAPHPLKNASQELQETLRRLEEDFVKTPWHERDRPQKFWPYDEINNPGRYPYRSAPIWMCEHGLCEKFGQQ